MIWDELGPGGGKATHCRLSTCFGARAGFQERPSAAAHGEAWSLTPCPGAHGELAAENRVPVLPWQSRWHLHVAGGVVRSICVSGTVV